MTSGSTVPVYRCNGGSEEPRGPGEDRSSVVPFRLLVADPAVKVLIPVRDQELAGCAYISSFICI
jgi:hypothetical protein